MNKIITTNYNKCIAAIPSLELAFKIDSNYSIPIMLYFQDSQEIPIHITVTSQIYNILVKNSKALTDKYINHAVLENNKLHFINIKKGE